VVITFRLERSIRLVTPGAFLFFYHEQMTNETRHRLKSPFLTPFRLETLPQSAAVLVILIGVLVVGGWVLDIQMLKTVFPGLISMMPNTAIGLILAGFSLLLQARSEPVPSKRLLAAQAFALIVTAIGMATLAEHIFNLDLGLDQLLFRENAQAPGVFFPFRMAPASALNFILLGIALLTLDVPAGRSRRWPAQYFTMAAAVLALLAFVGLFYGIEMHFWFVPYISIALHTVLAFCLLCLGVLLARPHRGVMAVFTSKNLGGVVARRMLPAAILVPLLIGWFRLQGQRRYGLGFGAALSATIVAIIFTILVVWAARTLDRRGAERERAAEILRQGTARLDGIISSAMDAIISINSQQRILLFNQAAEKMFGVPVRDALGQSIGRFIPARFRAAHARHVEGFGQTGVSARQMNVLGAISGVRASGEEFPIEASISQVEVAGEKLFTVILRDVTERKRAEDVLLESQRREHSMLMDLRALAARLQSVREEERTRIAREIHDVLAQELTRLKLDITWLNRRLAQPMDESKQRLLLERLVVMLGAADTAIQSVQKIATELRPIVLDTLGLCAAIEWQAKDFEARSNIRCTANVPDGNINLGRDHSTAVFRILQESLSNVARHAGATEVEIDLQREPECITLTVRDNGRGIQADELSDPHSLGLLGMRERAALLGGQCLISCLPGEGTAVEARFPLMPDENLEKKLV